MRRVFCRDMTSTATYDVCIVGGGAMGSATAYYAARSGLRVCLLEQNPLGGGRHGSSHGGSRITRRSDTDRVLGEMASCALREWSALEQASGVALVRRVGALDLGDPAQPAFARLLDTYRGREAFEIMTAAEIKTRWPAFAGVPDHWRGVFNQDGGVLSPDVTVPTLQRLATQSGATLVGSAEVVAVQEEEHAECSRVVYRRSGSRNGDKARVLTTIVAKSVVMAAGAWTSELLRASFGFQLPLDIWEITFAWYKLKDSRAVSMHANYPVWRAFGGSCRCYGFPVGEHANMVKVAPHGHTDLNVFSHPRERTGAPDPRYVTETTAFARKLFPDTLVQQDSDGLELERDTCLYSVTKDANFVIDWVSPRCLVLAGFSGSGFKHAPLVGKMAWEMSAAKLSDPQSALIRAPPSFPQISRFSIKRSSLFDGNTDCSRLTQEHQAVARSSL